MTEQRHGPQSTVGGLEGSPSLRLWRKVSKLFLNISTNKDCAPGVHCETREKKAVSVEILSTFATSLRKATKRASDRFLCTPERLGGTKSLNNLRDSPGEPSSKIQTNMYQNKEYMTIWTPTSYSYIGFEYQAIPCGVLWLFLRCSQPSSECFQSETLERSAMQQSFDFGILSTIFEAKWKHRMEPTQNCIELLYTARS